MSRQEHNALLTAIRQLHYAIKDSGITGPKTTEILKLTSELKARLHTNVPLTIASQSDI